MLTHLILFSKGYIIFLIFFMIIGMITNLKLNTKSILILGIFFAFTFSVIAFATVPYDSDDLSRYFYWIRTMDGGGLKFAFSQSPFKATAISNMLIYIVSIIGNEHFLPAIVTVIECSCLLYIIISEKIRKNVSTRVIISYAVICAAVIGLYTCVSGIRYNLSISIGAVVVYNDFIKNKKGIITIIGYMILPFIHTATITILVVRLLVEFKIFKKARLAFLILPIMIVLLKAPLKKLPLNFIKIIFEKIDIYQGVILAGQSYKRNIGYILFIFLFYIMLILIEKSVNKKNNQINIELGESRFINFMNTYSLFCMGTYFVIPEIFYRSTAFIAALSLPVFTLFKRSTKNKNATAIIYMLYILSIGVFYVYEYVLYYNKWMLIVR